jgi:hypothetical protein
MVAGGEIILYSKTVGFEIMTDKELPLCAIHIGAAESETRARETAAFMRVCPYTVLYVSKGLNVFGIMVLPESKRWWADLGERSELLGLISLQTFYTSQVDAHSPWSLGWVRPELPLPPCGSNCETCPNYQVKCQGCPASRFYRSA